MELTIDEIHNMTPEELEEYLDDYINNDELAPGAGFETFSVTNTDSGREIEMFGITLNDTDDIISVGLVILFVTILYIAKSYIDEFFGKRMERYKNNLPQDK